MSVPARELLRQRFRWIEGNADVWAVFRDAEALAAVVRGLVEPYRAAGVTAICGIESRGFLLGAAAAVELGAGFVAVRKGDGLFPGAKVSRQTDPDYRGLHQTLRLQRSALGPLDRVLLVDDWIETGNQALAVKAMVQDCGSEWLGCSVIVDQLAERQRPALGDVRGLISARDLPESRS